MSANPSERELSGSMKHERAEFKKGILAAFLPQFIFGLTFLFTRKSLDQVTMLDLLAWRFLIAFTCLHLLRFFSVIKVRLKGRNLKPLILMGLFEPVLYYICETIGIQRTSSSESSLMIAMIPIASMLLAIPMHKVKPTARQAVSIILSVFGVSLVVLARESLASLDIPGYLFLAMAVICAAFFGVISELAVDFSSSEKTYVQMGVGCLAFTVSNLIRHIWRGSLGEWLRQPIEKPGLLFALFFLGLLSAVLGYIMLNYAISRIGNSRTSTFMGLTTLISVLAGAIFLKEKLNALQGFGALLIIIGVSGAQDPKAAKYAAPTDG